MPPKRRQRKQRKESLSDVEGEGFKDFLETAKRVVTKLWYGDKSLPQNVVKFLQVNGEALIESATINRKPVQSAIKTALNVISFGKFEENLAKTPYDKLFHLSIDLRLSNGKIVKLEKNERINMEEIRSISTSDDDRNMKVSLPKITVNKLLENTNKLMGQNFFSYDGKVNNCQSFIIGILKANNSLTPEAQSFVKQDTEQLFDNIPWVHKIMNGITDLGAKVSIIEQGGKVHHIPIHLDTFPRFASHYYKIIAKDKGLTYRDMLKSEELKDAYNQYKQKKKAYVRVNQM